MTTEKITAPKVNTRLNEHLHDHEVVYNSRDDGRAETHSQLPRMILEYTKLPGPPGVKTINGIPVADIKTINGIPIADVKSVQGLT